MARASLHAVERQGMTVLEAVQEQARHLAYLRDSLETAAEV